MLSSLSSYIWGQDSVQEQDVAVLPLTVQSPRDKSPAGDDWVLVGGAPVPIPVDIVGGVPLPSGDLSPSVSVCSSDVEQMEPNEASEPNTQRTVHPTTLVKQAADKQFQSLKSAQITKQKNSGKNISTKALNRNNKALFVNGRNKQITRHSLNIKMAGSNKNLKQCWTWLRDYFS